MKSEKGNKSELTRREFIKKSSVSALGLSLLGSIPATLASETINQTITGKSKVVLVRNTKVISPEGIVDNDILSSMLDTAITNYSGDSPSIFWPKIFSPKDIIGLKVNTLGLNQISGSSLTNHFSAVTNVIIQSCKEAGIKEENFIIWDRSNEELTSAGYQIQNELGKTRILGNVSRSDGSAIGYSDKEIKVGDKSTYLAKILTDMCTCLINIPLVKDHGIAEFTGALKNHYGTINNAREFHSNNCTNPGIPEINLIDTIKSKQKLIIADALLGVFNGGPRWDRKFMWPYGGILVATDPVAIDTILFNILNDKRKSEGLAPINDSTARHIRLSAEAGLGKNNLNQIDFLEINQDRV